jgi:RHS repeat-associated protein
MHFTGKQRDTESGLDYFGARFDPSSMGRFMSPDWSDSPGPVPYASPRNPQSLNLYVYVRNNPLSATDDDGHDPQDLPPSAGECGLPCVIKGLIGAIFGHESSSSTAPTPPTKEPPATVRLALLWRAYQQTNDPDYKRYLIGEMLGIRAFVLPIPSHQNSLSPLGFLSLPTNVLKALQIIEMWGRTKGSGPGEDHDYANDGRNKNDEILPRTDADGNPITTILGISTQRRQEFGETQIAS